MEVTHSIREEGSIGKLSFSVGMGTLYAGISLGIMGIQKG